MLLQAIISLSIIVLTILIHGLGTTWGLKYIFTKHDLSNQTLGFVTSFKILSLSAIFLMVLHYIEIAIWAAVYLAIPQLKQLANWEEAIYFSMVTYTTVGYGDITLAPVWRILSGFEAMNGILLFGWSTAMFFSVVQRIIGQKIRMDLNK
jgi:voltage-gated potassium channel